MPIGHLKTKTDTSERLFQLKCALMLAIISTGQVQRQAKVSPVAQEVVSFDRPGCLYSSGYTVSAHQQKSASRRRGHATCCVCSNVSVPPRPFYRVKRNDDMHMIACSRNAPAAIMISHHILGQSQQQRLVPRRPPLPLVTRLEGERERERERHVAGEWAREECCPLACYKPLHYMTACCCTCDQQTVCVPG